MSGTDDALPRIELRDPTSVEVDLVRQLQRLLLTHPVACQAAFTALIAEGRRFAETEEGRRWSGGLVRSALLRDVRLVFDLSTLGLLEETAGATLPSNYLDALFMIASGGETDAVLNQIFSSGPEAHVDGRPRE